LLLFFVARKAVFAVKHRITSPLEGRPWSLTGSLRCRKSVSVIIYH
jgi:hypothetical protein